MNEREQYEKENGDVYASMENYGSFKDEYVKHLELKLENQAKDNDVLGDVVCSFMQKVAKDNSLPIDELYIQYDINDKGLNLYQDDYGNGIEYVKTIK